MVGFLSLLHGECSPPQMPCPLKERMPVPLIITLPFCLVPPWVSPAPPPWRVAPPYAYPLKRGFLLPLPIFLLGKNHSPPHLPCPSMEDALSPLPCVFQKVSLSSCLFPLMEGSLPFTSCSCHGSPLLPSLPLQIGNSYPQPTPLFRESPFSLPCPLHWESSFLTPWMIPPSLPCSFSREFLCTLALIPMGTGNLHGGTRQGVKWNLQVVNGKGYKERGRDKLHGVETEDLQCRGKGVGEEILHGGELKEE